MLSFSLATTPSSFLFRPDALEVMAGERQMDATAILDYFAPLKKWLDKQNAGHKVGWN